MGLTQYYGGDAYTDKCAQVVVPIVGVTAAAVAILIASGVDSVVRRDVADAGGDDGSRCYCWCGDCKR